MSLQVVVKRLAMLLVESDKVKMITFTGSPAVGIGIRNKAEFEKSCTGIRLKRWLNYRQKC